MTALWSDLPTPEPDYKSNVTLVRQSTIGQLQLCGKRVEYEGQEGYLEAVSEPLGFGQCMHYMVACTLDETVSSAELVANMYEWVDDLLHREYDWSLGLIPNVDAFLDELAVAYRGWVTKIRPRIKNVIAVEEEIFLPLGEGRQTHIVLRGTPDIVTKTRLRDTKTAGRGWTQDKADLSIQASLYLALVKQQYGLEYKDFTFDVYDRRKATWESIPVKRTVKQINSALKSAYDYGLQLEAGIFPATPVPEASFTKKRGWYCSPRFCGAWNICEYKYLADSVDENILAIRSWN